MVAPISVMYFLYVMFDKHIWLDKEMLNQSLCNIPILSINPTISNIAKVEKVSMTQCRIHYLWNIFNKSQQVETTSVSINRLLNKIKLNYYMNKKRKSHLKWKNGSSVNCNRWMNQRDIKWKKSDTESQCNMTPFIWGDQKTKLIKGRIKRVGNALGDWRGVGQRTYNFC